MKKIQLILTCFVSLGFLLAGCQPSDEKITDPRVKNYRGYSNKPSNGGTAAKEFKASAFAIAAFSTEKEVEILALVRTALEQDKSKDKSYVFGDKVKTNTGETFQLSHNVNSLDYKAAFGSYTAYHSSLMNVSLENSGETAGSFLLTSEGHVRDTVNSADPEVSSYLSSIQKTLVIEGKRLEGGLLEIQVKSEGQISGLKSDAHGSEQFSFGITMVVQEDSLKSELVKVVSISSIYSSVRFGKNWNIEVSGADHEIAYSNMCSKLNGISSLKSDRAGKPPKVITITDSSVVISDSKFNSKAAECGQRPTLDLSRLFVY